ncbi:MAG: HNH endonuclease signature motif containing protein [Miltoncostaeaceae bacterium]
MLREEPDAHFAAGYLRRSLVVGRRLFPPVSRGRYRAMMAEQVERPVEVGRQERWVWWLYADRVWRDDEGLTGEQVMALVAERERRRRRRIDRAVDLMHAERAGQAPPAGRREHIPEVLRREVFRRDGGRCTGCGTDELLQFDHIIPVALGGASTPENLQLLCAECNREKSDSL